MRQTFERTVGLGQAEEKGDAHERQEQRGREAGGDLIHRKAGQARADQKGEDNRDYADVDPRSKRNCQCDQKGQQRSSSCAHRHLAKSWRSTLPMALRGRDETL
jgi:hypothetical protein